MFKARYVMKVFLSTKNRVSVSMVISLTSRGAESINEAMN